MRDVLTRKFLTLLSGAAMAVSLGLPATALPMGGPLGGPQSFPLTKIDYREENKKQEAAYRCCIRYINGQPLKGAYCSNKYLDQAFSRGVIEIRADAYGREVCAPTGRPF